MIEIEHLSKAYSDSGQQHLQILNNLSLSVKPGEVVAIMGESGSGKSTLLGVLSGLLAPDAGHVSIANTNLTHLTEAERTLFRKKHIGIVFQQFHLVPHLTAIENVELPLWVRGQFIDTTQLAAKWLDQLQLKQRHDHMPAQLSGGEQQRVAIARALIGKPQVLLADEPTGNLDQTTADSVLGDMLKTIRESATTAVIVTHSSAVAKRCDRILQLISGQLAQ